MNIKENKRGVSKVTAVVLIVGIAVILASIITVSIGEISETNEPAPNTALEHKEQPGEIIIEHIGGDSISEDELSAIGGEITTTSDKITATDQIIIEPSEGVNYVELIWESTETDHTQQLMSVESEFTEGESSNGSEEEEGITVRQHNGTLLEEGDTYFVDDDNLENRMVIDVNEDAEGDWALAVEWVDEEGDVKERVPGSGFETFSSGETADTGIAQGFVPDGNREVLEINKDTDDREAIITVER